VTDDVRRLPQAGAERVVTSDRTGFVTRIATDEVGRVIMDWGGGRRKLGDQIDYSVGLQIHAKLGDRVRAGDPLAVAYYNDGSKLEEMDARLRAAYRIEESAPQREPLVKAVL
jgi:pyrimidine-nucleoside phosphorylase